VDLDDATTFRDWVAGTGAPLAPADTISAEQCLGAFDIDEDTDLDLNDFRSFQRVFCG
jgi:hypothetical protein